MKYRFQAISIFTVLLLSAFNAFADPVAWIADSNGCKMANVYPQEGETVSWTGQCVNQFADGKGVLTWYLNGEVADVFDGQLVQGWAQGMGRLIRKNGIYIGEWKDSLQDGTGTQHMYNNTWYQGQWKQGKPHGQGKVKTLEGKVFSGTWNEGVFVGEQEQDNRS